MGRPKGSKNKKKTFTRCDMPKVPFFDRVAPIIPPHDKKRPWRGSTKFRDEFTPMVQEFLSKTTRCCNMASIATLFRVTQQTIWNWRKANPDFDKAVRAGLRVNKDRWTKRMEEHAFEPGYNVNLGLIKFLSNHVYGMTDQPDVVINNNNSNTNDNKVEFDPEKELKKRGIPIPDLGIDDIPSKKGKK